MPELRFGAAREETVTVGHENAITFLGQEGPRVLSTPHMIGYMERTCRNLALSMLEPGHDTVGTHVNVSHCAAAPMGVSVTFHAELVSAVKNRLNFKVSARYGETVIGEGEHQRAAVDVKSFASRVAESQKQHSA
ncbi:MAG TPA: thioesterase family protein, partial [Bryobacteraceae bacterium]|jgi:fluoroacetyl-CoA thioesterase|nr:thioesterase family protein [Bryobacteraceae bacterium]